MCSRQLLTLEVHIDFNSRSKITWKIYIPLDFYQPTWGILHTTLYFSKPIAKSLKWSVMGACSVCLLSPQQFCQKLTAMFVAATPCRTKNFLNCRHREYRYECSASKWVSLNRQQPRDLIQHSKIVRGVGSAHNRATYFGVSLPFVDHLRPLGYWLQWKPSLTFTIDHMPTKHYFNDKSSSVDLHGVINFLCILHVYNCRNGLCALYRA